MKNIFIILLFVLFTLSCNKKLEFSNPVDPSVDLKTPTNLNVIAITETYAILQFNDPNYNPQYPNSKVDFVVERDNGDSIFVPITADTLIADSLSKAIDMVTVIDSNLFQDNRTYTYRVCAIRGDKKTAYSKGAILTFAFPSPNDLRVAISNETSARLTWTNTNLLASKIIIEKSANDTIYYVVDSVSATERTKDVAGIYSWDTTYYFRIKNIANFNHSSYSSSASDLLPFPAPRNLSFTIYADTLAKLTWSNENYFAIKVIIEKSTNGSKYVVIDSTSTSISTKEITGIYSCDTVYYFRIKNVSNFNQRYTQPVSQKISFPAPTDLQFTSTSTSEVNLNWVDRTSFETSFEIEQSRDSINYVQVKTVPANTNTAIITEIFDSLVTYSFRVRAKSTFNVSQYSLSQSFIITPKLTGMLLVQGGTFQMGSTAGASVEKPVHNVTLSDFYIGSTEVRWETWDTVYQWAKNNSYIMSSGAKGSGNTGGAKNPITHVTWYDVVKWCNACSEKEGLTPVYYINSNFVVANIYKTGWIDIQNTWVNWNANGYRLPTEAEWEYAAKGGNKSKGYTYSGSNTFDNVAWYNNNSGMNTHPVGEKASNELGLYDMSGNIAEWCWDWYGSYTSSSQTNPQGSSSGTYRVLRGGSANADYYGCRITDRNLFSVNADNHGNPYYASWFIGLRLARTK